MSLAPPDLPLLHWLAEHSQSTVDEIAQGCGTTVAGVRALVVYLEREGYVVERLSDDGPPRRVYSLTIDGRAACLM